MKGKTEYYPNFSTEIKPPGLNPFYEYMKLPLYLAFVILVSLSCYQPAGAQSRAIDSMKNALQQQKPDTIKALTYVRLSE